MQCAGHHYSSVFVYVRQRDYKDLIFSLVCVRESLAAHSAKFKRKREMVTESKEDANRCTHGVIDETS